MCALSHPTHPIGRTLPIHPWLKKLHLVYHPGATTPLIETFSKRLLFYFEELGHHLQNQPDENTDLILTTAAFGVPLSWRNALLFTARRRFHLQHAPTIYTLLHATPDQFNEWMHRIQQALGQNPVAVEELHFPGLAPQAPSILVEQGTRGGAILALERVLQAQAKCIRLLLLLGNEHPERVYHFDLVGAHAVSVARDEAAFYTDIVLRMATTESTSEVTEHQVVGEPIEFSLWKSLSTPQAMHHAARELGWRNFFTPMVRISDLVAVPAVEGAIASQYSEGCFATWDIHLGALIATITGSARPVDKGNLSEDDLAVIVGVRADGRGALVQHVAGKSNAPPSSEAVEMMEMDRDLPRVQLEGKGESTARVPVLRSKLHGHRGIRAYNPEKVEFVPLDPPYYYYPVSCATHAQAQGIKTAFSRAECLRHPTDARQVVFTVLPGHGAVIAEKWVDGKAPFQTIWEAMDAGDLEIEPHVPQGLMGYVPGDDGRMYLQEGSL